MRTGAAVPLPVLQCLLDQVGGAVNPVHDVQRPGTVPLGGFLLHAGVQPVDERGRLFPESQAQQGVHRERGVADPGEPVVPVALTAQLLGQSRRGGGDQRTGRRVRHELERHSRTFHRLPPAARVGGLPQPGTPEANRLVEEPLELLHADLVRRPPGRRFQDQAALLPRPQGQGEAQIVLVGREDVQEPFVLRLTDGMDGEVQVLRGEQSTVLRAVQLVRLTAVVEARSDLAFERHAAADTAQHADDTVPVGRGLSGHRHEVDDFPRSGLGHEARHQNGGVRMVELFGGVRPRCRPHGEVAAPAPVEQSAEDAGRIKPRTTEPVDRRIGCHEGRGLQITDQAMILDQRIVVHLQTPFSPAGHTQGTVTPRMKRTGRPRSA